MFKPFGAKALSNLAELDLDDLVARGVEEGLYIEYKRQWESHKVARAVASFANTHGGTLIVGIEANKLVPTAVRGIEDSGDLEERAVQTVRTSIDPVPAFAARRVTIGDQLGCLVVEVPEGTQPPYLLIRTGQILVRTAVGSEPVPEQDRESLDRLFARGQRGVEWARGEVTAISWGLADFPLTVPEWCSVHVATIPAVDDGLAAGARIFRNSFATEADRVVRAGQLAIFPGTRKPSMERGFLRLEFETANAGVLWVQVRVNGSLLTSWEGPEQASSSWHKALARHAPPIHRSILEGLLGHRGNVAVALLAKESGEPETSIDLGPPVLPGSAPKTVSSITIPRAREPAEVVGETGPVPIAYLSEETFLASLDRAIDRAAGYVVYEPEDESY